MMIFIWSVWWFYKPTMSQLNNIIQYFNEWADPSLAVDWDNLGLQIGDQFMDIKHIVVALDVDEPVLDVLTFQEGVLVVTHHSLFFKPLNHIRYDQNMGKIIQTFIHERHALFSAYTNLDAAVGGVNDTLISRYGFEPTQGTTILDGFGKYFCEVDKPFNDIANMFPFIHEGCEAQYNIQKIAFCCVSGHGY